MAKENALEDNGPRSTSVAVVSELRQQPLPGGLLWDQTLPVNRATARVGARDSILTGSLHFLYFTTAFMFTQGMKSYEQTGPTVLL